ncbi:MAG TPA: UDP-forming cellulose synthase catalytic subunit [Gammaproteobacteria bacterium]|nr:UDP-forming cellulose synthase catalytic subunit [Gammaproteobacteria bacterium]
MNRVHRSQQQNFKLPPQPSTKFTINPRSLLWAALGIAFVLVLLISSIPLTVEQQLLFALASLGLSLLLRPNNEKARFRVIVLVSISIIATGRYIFWRLTDSLGWMNSNIELTFLDYFFSLGLLAAEMYAWAVLFLGYFQTIWPLKREILPMPEDRSLWPSVDVFIPTYNEPLKVVSATILAAKNIDWPKDRLKVYVLDDGCREEFKKFSDEAGVHYIERESSEGAKAGNINHAMKLTGGEFIAIFDSDHVPVRSFLTKTMGWFLRDKKLGLVQTPHLFFTPDPVERNLQVFHKVPPEGQLFYGLVQDGNDTWDSTFFCGSCAVLKRQALDEVGGIATDTVTEDAHTSLLIQKNGWTSAYINTPLAAGLATERLSAHIGQRRRWARGMMQIFRVDNPLFAKGLNLGQRLCYFNAMLHFLFGLPRIVFLTAPLAYLFFEAYVIQASAALIAVYALPHIFQAQVANSVMQGRYRHSFWADVYETLISAHLVGPTLGALVAPKKGQFNVTEKGGVVKEDHFDWSSSRFVFFLLLLNLIGLVVAFVRLFWWNPGETGTVLINLGWTAYNSIILGAALSVAWERRQRRNTPRVHRFVEALVHTADGKKIRAVSTDMSLNDISLKIPPNALIHRGDQLTIELFDGEQGYKFKGTAATVLTRHLGVRFAAFAPKKMSDLIYFTHARDKSWDEWYNVWKPSKPLASFLEIVRFGVLGVLRALFGHSDDPESNRLRPDLKTAAWVVAILLLAASSYLIPRPARADSEIPATGEPVVLSFKHLGATSPIQLRGGNSQDDVWFSLRADQVAKNVELRLSYQIAQQLLKDYRSLDITLNGQMVKSIPINQETVEQDTVSVIPIDPLFVTDLNQLSFKLVPIEPEFCEKLDEHAISAEISELSEIAMDVHPLTIINDLSLFPIPFFDKNDDQQLILPFVMNAAMTQSTSALKASAILASWFGAKADYRGADFPVIDTLPQRHAVVFVTPKAPSALLPDLSIDGPAVSIMSHPDIDNVKLLVISGQDDDDLIKAVTALVSGQIPLAGPTIAFDQPITIPKRQAYDAPRWLKDGQDTLFSELQAPSKLVNYGISPKTISINFRVPPDLYAWRKDELPVHLSYHYTDLPLKNESSLDISLGENWLKSLDLDSNTTVPGSKPYTVQAINKKEPVLIRQVTDSDTTFLPMYQLAGINDLKFYYDLQLPDEAAKACASLYTRNMSTGITPDSHFSLAGWSHFTRMPDLAKFANLGFPYTRYADLSESAFILPNQPDRREIQVMLNTVGKMGGATGYPAFALEILFPNDIAAVDNKDLLVIGTDERQPLLQEWQEKLPVILSTESGSPHWTLRPLSLIEKAQLWWKGEKTERPGAARHRLAEIDNNIVSVISLQSPLQSRRTATLLLANHPRDLLRITQALNDSDTVAGFQGDVTLLSNQQAPDHFRLLPSYYVGELPWLTWLRWYLSNHILALILLFVSVAVILSLTLQSMMKEQARRRQPSHPQHT